MQTLNTAVVKLQLLINSGLSLQHIIISMKYLLNHMNIHMNIIIKIAYQSSGSTTFEYNFLKNHPVQQIPWANNGGAGGRGSKQQ